MKGVQQKFSRRRVPQENGSGGGGGLCMGNSKSRVLSEYPWVKNRLIKVVLFTGGSTNSVYNFTLARSPVASPFLCRRVEFRSTHPVWPVEKFGH